MRSSLVSLLRSLADRIDPHTNDPWGWGPSGPYSGAAPAADEHNPWGGGVPLEPDLRSAEHAGVESYVVLRLREYARSRHRVEPLAGSDGHTYRVRAGFDFSATLKALSDPVDLAAALSLHAIVRAGDEPVLDAYEQMRAEHGYHPEEISFVARPERGAIDIVIAPPGAAPKRTARRRRA